MRGPSMGGLLLSRRDRVIVARHEVPYVFTAISQSSSSSSFVRFSGDQANLPPLAFLHSSLFHPGKPQPPTEDEND